MRRSSIAFTLVLLGCAIAYPQPTTLPAPKPATSSAGKPLEEIILAASKGGDGKKALFNNSAQVWNHTFFWNSMKPSGGGKPTGTLATRVLPVTVVLLSAFAICVYSGIDVKVIPLTALLYAAGLIFSHRLADIFDSGEFDEYHRLQRPSSPTCKNCPELGVCGGGMPLHRWSNDGKFDNPSVYCNDQKTIIKHVRLNLSQEGLAA